MIFHHELCYVWETYCMAPWGSPNRFGDVSFSALCLGVRPSEKERQDPTNFISKCAKRAKLVSETLILFPTPCSGFTVHTIWHVNTFSKLSQELWHQRSWTLVHVEEELLCLQICVMWFYFKSCAVTIICLLYLTFNLLLLDESNDIQYLSCIHYHVMTSWTHKIQDNWGYILGVSLT